MESILNTLQQTEGVVDVVCLFILFLFVCLVVCLFILFVCYLAADGWEKGVVDVEGVWRQNQGPKALQCEFIRAVK